MAEPTLTNRQLNRALLARQMLLAREKRPALQAVEQLVGLQAQVPRPPVIGLWTRLEQFDRAELLGLVHKRTIVRATAMRATIHMMSASDFVSLRGALQPALDKGFQAVLRDRVKDLDLPALAAEARAFFGDAAATFDALRKHLIAKYPKGDERAMAYAIRLSLPLVQVPTDAPWGYPASADFALAESWLGKQVPTAHTPATTLVKRYLAAFGPATPGDAQAWSSLAGLRNAFEALRPNLVTFRDARKRELFDLPNAPRPSEDAPAPVRFIPEYDNLILSHDDRTRVMADEHRSLVTRNNLQVQATFLVNGFVSGIWKTERKKKTAAVIIEPFAKLTKKTMAELEREGDALLRFVEEDAEVREVRFKQ